MRRTLFCCAALVASILLGSPAAAFCGFYVAKADTKLFNEASKVVLVRDGNRTVLTMANDYQGDPKEFAVGPARCRLDRALWFADREGMLCGTRRGENEFDYTFVGLDGAVGERLPLPANHDLRPLVYLGDQDVLILTERWQGGLGNRWKWAVWVYRFDTGTAYRLLEDQFLGDSAIYAPS